MLGIGSLVAVRNVKAGPASGGLLVVANQKEHTVLVVDPDERKELAKVVVGVNGHEVMVSKDGRFAYVPIYGNSGVGRPGTDGSTIDVVDLQERKLAATIDLGKPLRPHRAEWGPDGMLYVTAELGNAVDVIDPGTRKIVAEIPTGQKESHMIVISPDGRWLVTLNRNSDAYVIDVQSMKVAHTLKISAGASEILIRPGGEVAYLSGTGAGKIDVLDLHTWELQKPIELTPGVDGMSWVPVAGKQ